MTKSKREQENLITTPTGYALWHTYNPNLLVYIPILERDCFVEIENIETKKPITLLERSLILFKSKSKNEGFQSCTELKIPVIQQWYGKLNAAPSLRHLLRVVKLTGWEGVSDDKRKVAPFRSFPEASHEIHSFYESDKAPGQQRLLFRFQFICTDQVAKRAGNHLATMMKSLPSQQGHRLVRPTRESYRQLFWAEMLDLYLDKDL